MLLFTLSLTLLHLLHPHNSLIVSINHSAKEKLMAVHKSSNFCLVCIFFFKEIIHPKMKKYT